MSETNRKELSIFYKRIILIAITEAVTLFKSMGILYFITKNLNIPNYGIWVLITTTIDLLPPIITLGLPYGLLRFIPENSQLKDYSNEFYSIFIFSLISSVIFDSIITFIWVSIEYFSSSNLLGSIPFNVKLNILLIFFLLTPLRSLIFIVTNFLRGRHQFKKYAIYVNAYNIITFGIIFIVINTSLNNLPLALSSLLISDGIITLVMLADILVKIPFRSLSFNFVKKYFSFSFPLTLALIMISFVSSSNRFLISLFLGVDEVGIFNPVYVFSSLILYIAQPFGFIIPPLISKAWDDKMYKTVDNYLLIPLKIFLLCALPTIMVLAYNSKFILTLLATKEIADQSYYLAGIILISMLFYGVQNILVHKLFAMKQTKLTAKLWVLTSLINLTLNILLIPSLRLLGASISILISYFVICCLTFYYTSTREFSLKLLRFIAKLVPSLIIVLLIIIAFPITGFFTFLLINGIAAIVYLLTAFMFRTLNIKEISVFF